MRRSKEVEKIRQRGRFIESSSNGVFIGVGVIKNPIRFKNEEDGCLSDILDKTKVYVLDVFKSTLYFSYKGVVVGYSYADKIILIDGAHRNKFLHIINQENKRNRFEGRKEIKMKLEVEDTNLRIVKRED